MEQLIVAFGPAFAAGFAVQQLLEICDSLIEQLLSVLSPVKANQKDETPTKNAGLKKLFLALISLFAGFVLAIGAGLRVLAPLGVPDAGFADVIVTALIISAGTEGFNSIMKFLGYTKENKKETVKLKQQEMQNDE